MIDEAGAPIPDVRVYLASETTAEFAVTDAYGTFRFAGVTAGEYLVTLNRGKTHRKISVSAGEDVKGVVLRQGQ